MNTHDSIEYDSDHKAVALLDWFYERAIGQMAGLDSAQDLAATFLQQDGSLYDKINALIRQQNWKSAGTGFVTNLGGVLTLPVALPANIASVLFIQIRMIAAIAHMCGYDIRNPKVKTMVYIALCGSAISDVLKDVGVRYGTHLTAKLLNRYLTTEMMKSINKLVGFRLFGHIGSRGLLQVGRFVPVFGGVMAGSLDALTTNVMGNTARHLFLGQVGTPQLTLQEKSEK